MSTTDDDTRTHQVAYIKRALTLLLRHVDEIAPKELEQLYFGLRGAVHMLLGDESEEKRP